MRSCRGLATAMARRWAGRDFGPLNNADQTARLDRIVNASHATVCHEARVAGGDQELPSNRAPVFIPRPVDHQAAHMSVGVATVLAPIVLRE